MRLVVQREYVKDLVDETYYITPKMLGLKSTHLFIASYKWESISIDLDDCIPSGYLRCLPLVCQNIKVRLPETITDHTVQLLSEIYPELGGKIRKQYMFGQPVEEVLQSCLVQ